MQWLYVLAPWVTREAELSADYDQIVGKDGWCTNLYSVAPVQEILNSNLQQNLQTTVQSSNGDAES